MSGIELLMLLFIPFVIYLWITNLKKLNIYYNESKNDYYEDIKNDYDE